MYRMMLMLCMAVTVGGCGTYMEAKEATRAGGTIDRQKAAANADLAVARAENARLQDEQLNRQREIDRVERRIQAAQDDLVKQQEALAAALRSRQITQGRHDQVRRDLDSIRAEMSAVELEHKMDRTTDPRAQAEKERKLAALEKRKRELEGVIAAMIKK